MANNIVSFQQQGPVGQINLKVTVGRLSVKEICIQLIR